jgi:hypothetical protein
MFKLQLRNSQAKAAITLPTKSSSTAIITIIEASNKANRNLFNGRFADNFNSIN